MKKIFPFVLIVFFFCGIHISFLLIKISRGPLVSYGHIILKDTQGNIITNKGLSGGYMVPYTGALSGKIFDSIITIEDKRFYDHNGIDWRAKISGIKENIEAGSIVRGSSTLTEQYIKNAYFRGAKRSILQKIDEAIAALWIELTHSKEEIKRGYLDNIYFGNNIYGIQTAINFYFPGKSKEYLTEDEILDLITRIHSPNIGNNEKKSAINYRYSIAKKLGWKTESDGLNQQYQRTGVELYPLVTERILAAKKSYCTGDLFALEKWTYTIPSGICHSNSIELNLSLLLDLQNYSHEVIQKTLSRMEKENVTGSAVYIYNPNTKKILAYIGNRGINSDDKNIDMITRRRSVGSILKPFIYLLALKNGAELENLILDDTKTYPTGIGERVFVPQNYNPHSYGPIRLREALGNSLNSSTVRLSESLGIGRIYDFFRDVGLDLNHDVGYYGYGISLGTVELSLENIVESYAFLTQIEDPDMFLIQTALGDAKNRAKTFGISSILNSSIDLPVKTGTSTDFRDNWTISYHKDAIIGIWVGNTDGSSMEDVSGISGAAPIWHTIAEYMIAQGYIKKMMIKIPLGVTEAYVCLDNRCLQKEHSYIKNPEKIKSRPKDQIYYESDFLGTITEQEKEKWNIQ